MIHVIQHTIHVSRYYLDRFVLFSFTSHFYLDHVDHLDRLLFFPEVAYRENDPGDDPRPIHVIQVKTVPTVIFVVTIHVIHVIHVFSKV